MRQREQLDPSDDLIRRLADCNPRVKKGSQVSSAAQHKPGEAWVRDKETGESGIWFWADEIRWITPEEVEVDAGYYEAPASAQSSGYQLKKKLDGKWRITRHIQGPISWSKEAQDHKF